MVKRGSGADGGNGEERDPSRHETNREAPTTASEDLFSPTIKLGRTPSPVSPVSEGVLAVGSVFAGRYEITGLLGEGGMGRVYRARDLELDREIAIKTIRAEIADDSMLQRFKQELVLARQITHKNVVRIHDLGEASGIKYITMEYIEGESLKDLMVRQGKLGPEEAMRIVLPVLSALEEAHEQGVVHRDLKPQNIMIDRRGVPYIMDFGIARSERQTGVTATGSVLGTPHYMSPEQAMGQKAGPAADLYSLGVILYQMLTGSLPFHGDTAVSQIMARLHERPRPPRELDASIPPYLEALILKCLEMDPELRYRSAEAIRSDLADRHVSRSFGDYTLRLQKAMRRRRALVAAIAATLVGVGLVTLLVVRLQRAEVAGAADAADSDAVAAPEVVATLALLPLANATGSPERQWMRTGVPEMLVTDLAQSRFVRPVSAARIYRLLDELGVGDQTRFDEATLGVVAARAPADYVLHGQFVEAGGQLRMSLSLWEATTKNAVPLRFDGAPDAVFALVDGITEGVKSQLSLTPEQLRADNDRPVSDVSTASVGALIAYQQGLDAFRAGSLQMAMEHFEVARREDQSFALANAKLAEAYLYSGRPPEAEEAIERARRLAEESDLPLAERYQINAVAGLVRGDYGLAAQNLEALARIYPADPDVLLQLAQAYEEVGDLHGAQEAYERVTEVAPGTVAAVLGLGRVQVSSGQHMEAISSLERALAEGRLEQDLEARGMAYSILGVAHREIGEHDRAIEHLESSLEVRKEIGDVRGQAVTLFNLASIYEYRGDIRAALAAERRAADMGREMGDEVVVSQALSNMGLTYKTAGNLPDALQAFEESLRIEMGRGDHSDEVNRLNQIAEIYRLMGDYTQAVIYLERARDRLETAPQPQELAINLIYTGQAKRAQGEYDAALEALLEALPILQEIHQVMGVATVHNNLGLIYMDQGRYGDALASLRKSLELYEELHVEHDLAEVQAPLGALLIEVGRLQQAAETLAAAEHAAHEAHAEGIMPEILLGKARLDHLQGRGEEAAAAIRAFNFQANLSRQKEIAVASRIELSLLYLEEGQLDVAERLVTRTRKEAADADLRPLEAAAAAARARIFLAQGKAEASRAEALDAISMARRFFGRPILWRAQVTLGEALQQLGRSEEALDAYADAAQILRWIRDGLSPEHQASFVGRQDIRAFVLETAEALAAGQRVEEAAGLEEWLEAPTIAAGED